MFVTCFIVFSFAHAEACAQKQSAKLQQKLHLCKYLQFFLDFFTFRKLYIAFVTHESCICLILSYTEIGLLIKRIKSVKF